MEESETDHAELPTAHESANSDDEASISQDEFARSSEPAIWRRSAEDWPSGFTDLGDGQPKSLWRMGPIKIGERKVVAIVGSRRSTVAGLVRARALGEKLSKMGISVISGLARGIDSAALSGALQGAAPAIAILGNGLPRIYPPENHSLAEAIIDHGGGVVTEYPSSAPPRAAHFPQRNRLISAWAETVVVVEATSRSGSLGTAHRALEMGRSVLAFPGSVESGEYGGCHALIREGAHLVENVDDVTEVILEQRQPGEHSSEKRQLARLWKLCGESGESPHPPGPEALDLLQQRTGWSAAYLLQVWWKWQEHHRQQIISDQGHG